MSSQNKPIVWILAVFAATIVVVAASVYVRVKDEMIIIELPETRVHIDKRSQLNVKSAYIRFDSLETFNKHNDPYLTVTAGMSTQGKICLLGITNTSSVGCEIEVVRGVSPMWRSIKDMRLSRDENHLEIATGKDMTTSCLYALILAMVTGGIAGLMSEAYENKKRRKYAEDKIAELEASEKTT